MFARVTIAVNKPRKALLVPETALIGSGEGEGKVFTVQGGAVSSRRVKAGKKLGDEREILSGLAPGEVVVLRPDGSLKDGVYVSLAD